MANQCVICAKGRHLHRIHAKITGDPVVRPTKIDEAHKLSSTDRSWLEVVAEWQRMRVSVGTPRRIVHNVAPE